MTALFSQEDHAKLTALLGSWELRAKAKRYGDRDALVAVNIKALKAAISAADEAVNLAAEVARLRKTIMILDEG
jgi:hypothetical protein